jgi:hypothetical protein
MWPAREPDILPGRAMRAGFKICKVDARRVCSARIWQVRAEQSGNIGLFARRANSWLKLGTLLDSVNAPLKWLLFSYNYGVWCVLQFPTKVLKRGELRTPGKPVLPKADLFFRCRCRQQVFMFWVGGVVCLLVLHPRRRRRYTLGLLRHLLFSGGTNFKPCPFAPLLDWGSKRRLWYSICSASLFLFVNATCELSPNHCSAGAGHGERTGLPFTWKCFTWDVILLFTEFCPPSDNGECS